MRFLFLIGSLLFVEPAQATTLRDLGMLRYRRELQTTDTCDEALQSIYVSDYERKMSPCSCQVIGDQTIIECNQYSYCKECVADAVLGSPLCGEQSNRFVVGLSAEYCVNFSAAGVESTICLSESRQEQEESCQVTVDGNRCRSCQQIACGDGSADVELDCSNLANEWGSDATCQGNSIYNPVAGLTGVLSFGQCHLDPDSTAAVPPDGAPVSLATKAPAVLSVVAAPSPVEFSTAKTTPEPSTSPVAAAPSTNQQKQRKNGLPVGAIAGIVVSGLAIVSLACGVAWLVVRRRGHDETPTPQSHQLRVLPKARSFQASDQSSGNQIVDTSSCSEQ